MRQFTLEQFQAQLLKLGNARGTVLERATGTSALKIKTIAYTSAVARVHHTPKPAPFWVKYKVVPTADGAKGWVGPRGGFAYLADLGSYKHPSGYPVRSHRRRAKFAESGVRRAAWHPPIKAQPWWQAGVDRAATEIPDIYQQAVVAELRKQFG